MNSKEFDTLLKESLRQSTPAIDNHQYESVKTRCAHALAQKAMRKRINFGQFLLLQCRFIGWKIWLIQGSILALVIATFLLPVMDYLTLGELTKVICSLSILTGTSILPLFYLSFFYRMHEVETATRFSAPKLLLAKSMIIMVGNAFLLATSFFAAHIITDLTSLNIALALLLPFLLSISGTLYFWNHFHATTALYAGLLWNVMLLVLIISTPQLYVLLSQAPILWTLIGLLSLLFCNAQGLRLISHPRFSDYQHHLI